MAPMKLRQQGKVRFIDIRRDKGELSLLQATLDGLNPQTDGFRSLPTLLLYDERGLKLFEQITYLQEYYLTNAEIDVLKSYSCRIAERIAEGTRLIELGSGNLRKVEILLKAFEEAGKHVEYYALDLSLVELERTFSQISTNDFECVQFNALHGTYDDCLAWLELPENQNRPTCVMSLGSSIGNFSRKEAAEFLASFSKVLGSADSLLVGLDACQNPDRVYPAYNDSKGITEKFYRNGLEHANRLLGRQTFLQEEWKIRGQYNEIEGRHEAIYVALKDAQNGDIFFRKGDKIFLESAYKYSAEQSHQLWRSAGLVQQMAYGENDYHVNFLTPAKISYQMKPTEYAAEPLPSQKDWEQLWTVWDTVTRAMVPQDELMNKPIKLRNNLIFYLGHIPAFADIHYTRATGEKPCDPAFYQNIFERGIDPDVDNPEICHAHSEIPDTWPPLEEILDYQARVRARITDAVTSGQAKIDRKLARGIWLAFEHEAMHLETFLYMLLQSKRVLPPPGHAIPDFKSMALEAKRKRIANTWHSIPASEFEVGMNDPENDLGSDRYFVWDNERPARKVQVHDFEAASRPISNGEYAHFLEETGYEMLPASWSTTPVNGHHTNGAADKPHTNGVATTNPQDRVASDAFIHGKYVRTVFGLVQLEYTLDWPVMASYDELAAFARWAGGRIPTYEEAKSIYNFAEMGKRAEAANVSASLISAVNGHLVNEGVEETPPSNPSQTGGRVAASDSSESAPHPSTHFIDLTGTATAFSTWHPVPVTHTSHLRGQSDMGGLWEWTSSPLTPHAGFEPMELYPGYTADFFDGKHNVVLGGSWGTAPRVAGRRSFINWYQRNYVFAWVGGRLVRDKKEGAARDRENGEIRWVGKAASKAC